MANFLFGIEDFFRNIRVHRSKTWPSCLSIKINLEFINVLRNKAVVMCSRLMLISALGIAIPYTDVSITLAWFSIWKEDKVS